MFLLFLVQTSRQKQSDKALPFAHVASEIFTSWSRGFKITMISGAFRNSPIYTERLDCPSRRVTGMLKINGSLYFPEISWDSLHPVHARITFEIYMACANTGSESLNTGDVLLSDFKTAKFD